MRLKKNPIYKKIPYKFFSIAPFEVYMSVSKVYRIFLKGECISEEYNEFIFNENWKILNNLVGLVKTDYVSEDLSYEVEVR